MEILPFIIVVLPIENGTPGVWKRLLIFRKGSKYPLTLKKYANIVNGELYERSLVQYFKGTGVPAVDFK